MFLFMYNYVYILCYIIYYYILLIEILNILLFLFTSILIKQGKIVLTQVKCIQIFIST